jgi:phosphoglycerate dehydrogenase-like enzyme
MIIWCNAKYPEAETKLLVEGTRGHQLVFAERTSASPLDAGRPDAGLASADIAIGQPDPAQCLASKKLRWVEVNTAGYTRYDTPEFLEGFKARGAVFSNVSQVFADPCAQHLLAQMLAFGRRLLPSYQDQLTNRGWEYTKRRYDSRLLTGQSVLMLGYGAIGRRLTELLAPFNMKITAVRRKAHSTPAVRIISEELVSSALGEADHVVNILPDNPSTRHYVNARRLSCFKPGARFYNVGRGATVDERALVEALKSGRVGEAYLDALDVEPLPKDSPLWAAPNCYITPHTGGGRHDQDAAIVKHFLDNLEAFTRGQPMVDRVV